MCCYHPMQVQVNLSVHTYMDYTWGATVLPTTMLIDRIYRDSIPHNGWRAVTVGTACWAMCATAEMMSELWELSIIHWASTIKRKQSLDYIYLWDDFQARHFTLYSLYWSHRAKNMIYSDLPLRRVCEDFTFTTINTLKSVAQDIIWCVWASESFGLTACIH